MAEVGISLGWNCYPASFGVQCGFRGTKANGYKTCVFDECVSNYKGIVECIKDDFKYFLDSDYLKLVEAPFSTGGIVQGEILLYNTKYNLIFNHESPGHADLYITQAWPGGINHYLDNDFYYFKQRYSRRIDNFRKYIKENKINFLINRFQENVSELNDAIKSTYGDIQFSVKQLIQPNSRELFTGHLKLMNYSEDEILYELGERNKKPKIFIFVVGSFEEKAYRYFIKMRKLQLAKYNIPHRFLFDGPCPEDYTPDVSDVFYDKPQPPFAIPVEQIPSPNINPHMIIKFMKAVKDTNFNPSEYDYILRINLSTFINFPKLYEVLPQIPTSRSCAAHTADMHFDGMPLKLISGTAQIFTPDFITWFRDNIHFDNPTIYMENDDVILSYFAQEQQLNTITLPLTYNRQDTTALMVRLKAIDNRFFDVQSWAWLLKAVDGLEIT